MWTTGGGGGGGGAEVFLGRGPVPRLCFKGRPTGKHCFFPDFFRGVKILKKGSQFLPGMLLVVFKVCLLFVGCACVRAANSRVVRQLLETSSLRLQEVWTVHGRDCNGFCGWSSYSASPK